MSDEQDDYTKLIDAALAGERIPFDDDLDAADRAEVEALMAAVDVAFPEPEGADE